MAKPTRHRFSIGIDLGTSNCALAYIDLREGLTSRILEIPQWEAADRETVQKVLPSFAYYPKEGLETVGAKAGWTGKQVVGLYARDVSAREPGRVIASAKSWLTHAGVDRRARILPWASREIPEEAKLSPVEASALYLGYLRAVWNQELAREDERNGFDRQHIVITVPASFDQAAQKLTLEAAHLAGYPDSVRLLEEPQAAFHAWLERHPETEALQAALNAEAGRSGSDEPVARHVLVCDIGGGTSDFSRFAIEFRGGDQAQIRRIAVSDHILLGGDNIDLALARMLERQVVAEGAHLDPGAWQRLVAESRKLKEKALADLSDSSEASIASPGPSLETAYRVGVSASGGSLFTQTKTAVITLRDILDLIDEGFFPLCEADEGPRAGEAGLREMGLPYARDSAVTRYLAAFLASSVSTSTSITKVGEDKNIRSTKGMEPLDAILFNGGALTPRYLQRRLQDLIGKWQKDQGPAPVLLENRELDLAVARGAAVYGRNLATGLKPRISGGAGHGFYLEVASPEKKEGKYLLCILPLGTELEQVQRIEKLDLHLAVNRPVEFRLYDSPRRLKDRAGNILKYSSGEFRELPPLRTVARLEPDKAKALGSEAAPVTIHAMLNSLGLLQVFLVSTHKSLRPSVRWELEFDLSARLEGDRIEGDAPATDAAEEEQVPSEKKERVAAILGSTFAPGVLAQTEEVVGRKRATWPRSWLRQFWEPLHTGITLRHLSPEFEAAWLNAAGFLLRPGFGMALDDYRMDQLWLVHAAGLAFPKSKSVRDQYWLMWRRVAGGLDAKRQTEVFEEAGPLIESHHKLANEAVGMAGSFERLPPDRKEWLLDILLEGVERRRTQHLGHYLWALGRLLSRIPLYAGEEAVLPPSAVERCYAFFKEWDWNTPRTSYLPVLFAQACRVTNHRILDVPAPLRGAVSEKLRSSGASPRLLKIVTEFVPVEREDLNQLFGEQLPLGLAIQKFS